MVEAVRFGKREANSLSRNSFSYERFEFAGNMEFVIPDHPPMMLANQTEARRLAGLEAE